VLCVAVLLSRSRDASRLLWKLIYELYLSVFVTLPLTQHRKKLEQNTTNPVPRKTTTTKKQNAKQTINESQTDS